MARREPLRIDAPFTACAYVPCSRRAVARVEATMGLADVCREHYLFLAQREADLYCDAQGLKSAAQMREFCKQRVTRFGRQSFDEWAGTITQNTIAILVRCGGNERLFAKLRDGGYLDADLRVTRHA